jgi:hypothetical protein
MFLDTRLYEFAFLTLVYGSRAESLSAPFSYNLHINISFNWCVWKHFQPCFLASCRVHGIV